jgi:hypothetical protein
MSKLKRRRQQQPEHPSIYFFLALGIGLALLIALYVMFLRNPPKVAPPAKKAQAADQAISSAQRAYSRSTSS